jgi:hypothetical protein
MAGIALGEIASSDIVSVRRGLQQKLKPPCRLLRFAGYALDKCLLERCDGITLRRDC